MKISVIIPAHNEEKSIKKTINSILNSTYSNYEIIVVDNGSTDKTKEIIKSFKNKKINYYFYDKKRGPAAARNYGALKANGEIIFFVDADDWLRKDNLKVIVDNVKKYPKLNLFIIFRKNVFEKGFKKLWSFEFFSYEHYGKKWYKKNSEILKECAFCPYVWKKNFFNKIKGFDENIFYFEDEILNNKLVQLKEPCLSVANAEYYTNMGNSFDDFFKRAKNLGRGIASVKKINKILYLLITNLSFIFLINPYIFLAYFLISSVYWLRVSKSFEISVFAPFLWIFKKIISFYYMIFYFLKL